MLANLRLWIWPKDPLWTIDTYRTYRIYWPLMLNKSVLRFHCQLNPYKSGWNKKRVDQERRFSSFSPTKVYFVDGRKFIDERRRTPIARSLERVNSTNAVSGYISENAISKCLQIRWPLFYNKTWSSNFYFFNFFLIFFKSEDRLIMFPKIENFSWNIFYI